MRQGCSFNGPSGRCIGTIKSHFLQVGIIYSSLWLSHPYSTRSTFLSALQTRARTPSTTSSI